VETIRIFRRDDVLGNVRRRGAQLAHALQQLTRHPWVRDVRGRGLMWGIELADPRDGRPAGELAARVQRAALRRGLIVELGGRQDSVVRLLPPLTITEEITRTASEILADAIEECHSMIPAAPGPLAPVS
jgi:diaminobutyrate-2-oxoglutarate transaminase